MNDEKIDIKKAITTTLLKLPLFLSKVKAGFPSPCDDYMEKSLDINEFLVKHPAATYFVRASGDSMINAGIQNGDILVVDRSLKPKDGQVIVASLNGEFTVKRLKLEGKRVWLCPENEDYKQIEIKEDMDFIVWGVVTAMVRNLE